MENSLEQIDKLIARGKRLRDRERYEEAIRIFDEAILLIKDDLQSASAAGYKFDLARRLADCYGLQGGCYRRWGLAAKDESARANLLLGSIKKYREGERIETNKEYGIVSTYNLLNRTVSQILLDPRFLYDPSAATKYPGLGPSDARAELKKVSKEMEHQMHRDDSWFLADKALVSLLLDDNDKDPKDIYKEFLNPEKIHPNFVYDSMLAILRPLAELDLPRADKLREIVQRLDERLKQLQN